MTDRPPRTSPVFRSQLDQMTNATLDAFKSPSIEGLLGNLSLTIQRADGLTALRADDTDDGPVDAALTQIVDRLQAEAPAVVSYWGPQGIKKLVLSAFAGQTLEPLTFQRLPGQPDTNPSLVLNEDDVGTLQGKIRPGEIWVNATNLSEEEYRGLWGAVSYQQQAALGRLLPAGGRPRGSIPKARLTVAEWIRAHPQATNAEIYEVGLEHALWQQDGNYYEDPRRNWRRVNSLKSLVSKISS